MTKTNWSALITDLPEEDRKAVEEKIKMLQYVLRNCELYLKDYAAGEQTVIKFLTTTEWVCREITATRSVLVLKHELPGFPIRP